MEEPLSLRLASRDKIAVSISEASQLVPFSEDYLRKAIHRTAGNPLAARQVGAGRGKYFIMVDDLTEWIRNEGKPA